MHYYHQKNPEKMTEIYSQILGETIDTKVVIALKEKQRILLFNFLSQGKLKEAQGLLEQGRAILNNRYLFIKLNQQLYA